MLLPRKFDRRDFLKGLGTSAMLLPYLPILKAQAAAPQYPTRAIFVVNGEGTIEESLWPTGTETNFTFPAGSILEPLAPIKQNMIAIRNLQRMLRGVDSYGAHERNMADTLTAGTLNPGPGFGGGGWATYPSVDQVIAKAVPQPTRFQTLEYAAMPGTGGDQMQRIIFAGSDQPITPMSDPVSTFQRVFGDFSLSQAQLAAQFQQKKSVLDMLSKQLGQVRQRIGSADYQKVDSHLQSIRALEVSLQPGALSAACVAPTPSGAIDLTNTLNYPMVVKLQNDIMVRSLVCDMTRIASMQYSRAQCPLYFQWIGVNSEHHQMTHDDTADDRVKRTLIQRWYAQQLLLIAQALQAVPEGTGTMLDNTIIMWTNESGNLGQAHLPFGAPTVLLGGGGGYFRTGRYIENTAQQYYSKQVLLNVCHAMGATSLTHLGDPDYGDAGPVATLKA